MTKSEFVAYMADKYSISKKEANGVIDMFIGSIMSALEKGEEVQLIGFGNFSVSKVKARTGRNPRTGESLNLKAYNQPKFKIGQKLKDAVNQK